jgi:hypothetical protein
MADIERLYFYAPEVRTWIQQLDGIRLPQRTLAGWLAAGLVYASLRWTDTKPARSGWKARGPGNACRFTVADFARVRFVARLRYQARLTIAEVLHVLRTLEPQLSILLREKSDARLIVEPQTGKVIIRRPGEIDYDVRSGQYMLSLFDVINGNEEAATRAREAA